MSCDLIFTGDHKFTPRELFDLGSNAEGVIQVKDTGNNPNTVLVNDPYGRIFLDTDYSLDQKLRCSCDEMFNERSGNQPQPETTFIIDYMNKGQVITKYVINVRRQNKWR